MNIEIFEQIYRRTIESIQRNFENSGKYDKEHWQSFNEGQLLCLIRLANMIDNQNKNQILDEVESLLF